MSYPRRFLRCILNAARRPYFKTETQPDPLGIKRKNAGSGSVQPKIGSETFDRAEAIEINQARMEHLASLHIPLEGKSVLDVGCGVGHLSQFFINKGCKVVCVDGRSDNIARLRQLYPNLESHIANVETDPLNRFGIFDVVFAYGLLYHLENPIFALRNMESVCQEVLLLETIICDCNLPVVRVADETDAFDQALSGIGCRPSPSYVVFVLNRAGFPHIYAPKELPKHEDFQFVSENNLEWMRDGHNLRCIFIATKKKLKNSHLISLVGD